jgi:hypothetical protein
MAAVISVTTGPGCNVFTVIFRGANSAANDVLNALNAPFVNPIYCIDTTGNSSE